MRALRKTSARKGGLGVEPKPGAEDILEEGVAQNENQNLDGATGYPCGRLSDVGSQSPSEVSL